MKYKSFLFLLCFSNSVFSQTTYAKEIEQKIKEVENNITGRLLVNGEKPSSITERMAKYHVKGLSIAIIHNYKLAWAKGYGWADEAAKQPVTPQTLFEPGSISKALNAVGILKLAQEKKVDLNTDINTYLTSWKFPYDSLSKGTKITPAHLLSHHAGLTVHGFPGHDRKGPIPSVYDILDGKKGSFTPPVRSMFEPGLMFQYSGGGTTISQVMLTDITKQSYETWMYENVLKPIGMINSFYNQPPPPDKQSLCAQAYEPDGTPILNKFHVYPEQAAAGLWMTPSDLCNYIIDMQLAYKGGKSKVLSPEMVKLHLTRYTSDGPTALGTFVENRKGALYFQHGAGNDGFCGTFYGSLEDGYGAVIFMNTSNPKLLNEVLNSVAKAYDWKNFYEAPSERKSIQQDEAVVKSLEGIYLFEGKWATVIKKEGEYRYYSDGVYAKMYFTDQNNFFNEEFSSEKEIVKDDKGNVAGFKRSLNGTQLSFAPRLTQIDTLSISEGMFNDIGWFLLENKKNTEALTYLKRANKLYPKSLIVLGNLAHAYLFTNDFEKALNIYKKHLGTIIDRDYTWNEMVKQDLLFFKKNGYDTTLLDKVFTELKLEKPEGY